MNFVAFDLETTGLHSHSDAIIEIGAARFRAMDRVETFSTLINPGCSIPTEASAVNGITDDMLVNQPDIQTVLGRFTDFCGDLPLVAHNAWFDYQFLLKAITLHHSRAPKGIVLDSCALARVVFPGLFNYKLVTLVRHFKFPSRAFHRAEDDSISCGHLFAHIVNALEKTGRSVTVSSLLKLINKSQLKFPQNDRQKQLEFDSLFQT